MNHSRKRMNASALLLGVCLLGGFPVRGQSSGRLKGTVRDASGGSVPGANLILFSDERVLTTKANEHGDFEFAPLPSGVRYIEARSNGFRTVSTPLAGITAEPVSLPPLEPGESGGPCGLSYDPPPSASYGERSGNVRLSGTVKDAYGTPLNASSLTLMKADLDAPLTNRRGLRGSFKEALSARGVTNEGGEFQFTDLEPGWYRLTVSHEGYSDQAVSFWVARENLTKVLPIYMIPHGLFTCTVPVVPPQRKETQ